MICLLLAFKECPHWRDGIEIFDGKMDNHMPTLLGVFVGCLYNVYIRPLIPRSSSHSCDFRRETHQSDFGPEQGISRSHASVTGHPGRIDVALPRTAVWVSVARLWGNPDWRVKFVYIVPSIYLAWLCLLQIWGLLADDHQQRWPKCIRCDPTTWVILTLEN